MKKEDHHIKLHGTNEEKAIQLKNIMMQEPVSVDALNAILPYEQEFFRAFVETFRIETEKETKFDENYVNTMNNTLTSLSNLITNDNVDNDIRLKILDTIAQISKDVSDVQKTKTIESSKTKRLIVGATISGAIVIAALLVFGSRKNNGGINTTNLIH